MGLDMYARTTKRRLKSAVDFATKETDQELHYWRKHPNLHGWMENLYRRKGGAQEFNCTTVQLTPNDIDLLEVVIGENKLPQTCRFFFGESDGSEREDDLAFLAKARAAFEQGLCVYYTSWW
ncbi:MAG: phosphoglycerate kinase [Rhodomicrobium sp.]